VKAFLLALCLVVNTTQAHDEGLPESKNLAMFMAGCGALYIDQRNVSLAFMTYAARLINRKRYDHEEIADLAASLLDVHGEQAWLGDFCWEYYQAARNAGALPG